MKNNYKKITIAILVIIVLVVAIVLNSKGKSNDVTITAIFPMTGGLASYGDSASKASILAVEEINTNGGINGKTLKLNLQDHKCDAKEAVSIYKQFQSTTNLFSSIACSGTALAIAPMLENDNKVLLGTTITTPKLSGISRNLFRNWSSDAKEAELFANLLKNVNYQKIGIIYEQTDYAKGLKDSLEKNIIADDANNSNKKEIYSESFVTGSTDVRSQLTKLQADNVDVIFISPQTVTSAEVIIKQMIELNFKPRIILVNDNIIKSAPTLKAYSAFLQGAYGGDFSIATSKSIEDFKIKYQKRFGEDCKQINICIAQYDAINMIADSLRATAKSNYDSQKIQEYIKNINYSGISGEISFDEKNDRKNATYTLFKVNGGVAIEVK